MLKDNNQDVFPKTSINWEITTYEKLLYKMIKIVFINMIKLQAIIN